MDDSPIPILRSNFYSVHPLENSLNEFLWKPGLGSNIITSNMFEKSLYDLIKGLRNHKGTEEDYIQNSLRECKAEIKSQDMDKKATALLKVIYLEMFGYDMSWASFHVLEVMSSSKHLQKRVGYLGAMQSFGPETEVLMLATNLLKKDISSSNIPNMSLPMVTLPHIITPPLSTSLLSDTLSRLSHSHVMVRKKAIVCLYRLSLVYPEALKLAWPKIKERLMDDQEDSSVTTAVINVVCELGWRRPQDFLPLAPRLFDLLVDGGNNWMAIKIIKLFATLTPLEPRLIRKLLRPLTNVIQTTTAMSLLYECINGIVQGGILDGDESFREKDEIASLCVGKLRGMIVTDADPNLKYVALLAFNRIVASHPLLVSMQQDVILNCLEDADFSIRIQALELATGMVTNVTVQSVVNRLVKQLNNASLPLFEYSSKSQTSALAQKDTEGYLPYLPPEYKLEVLHRILDICSYNNYSELPDFEWYIDILVQLVKHLPLQDMSKHRQTATDLVTEVACRLGSEIRNIAVRVRNVRTEATRAAESLIFIHNKSALLSGTTANDSILSYLAWVVGEYAEHLSSPGQTLQFLIDPSNVLLPTKTLSLCLQAIPKILVCLTTSGQSWDTPRKSETSLLLVQVIEFLGNLASHPHLDVQERAIEFLEVLRLTMESVHSETHPPHGTSFFLSAVVPGLFSGLELNPVAVGAQKRVPLPEKLILDQPLNESLWGLFNDSSDVSLDFESENLSRDFYYARDMLANRGHTENNFANVQLDISSYQNSTGRSIDEMNAKSRRRVERKDRNRDDPFYIDTEEYSSGTSTPFHKIFHASNGDALDVDAIPVIDLKLESEDMLGMKFSKDYEERKRSDLRPKKHDIAADETIGYEEPIGTEYTDRPGKVERSLLQIDTSGLGHLSLEETPGSGLAQGRVQGNGDDVEMIKAMREVERVRLDMQRASERIHPNNEPTEGTLVKKKKKRSQKSRLGENTKERKAGKK